MGKVKYIVRLFVDWFFASFLVPCKRNSYKKYRKRYLELFQFSNVDLKYNIISQIYNLESFFESADFVHDSWGVIRNMSDFYNLFYLKLPVPMVPPKTSKSLSPIVIKNNKCVIDSFKREKEWIYYLLKNQEKNILIDLNVSFLSEFTEFQFDFLHKSIYERLRFMVVDNTKLVFEVVSKGMFFVDLKSIPFSFELNRVYNVRIIILGNKYSFIVNDKTLMTITNNSEEKNNQIYDIAFILWDNKDKSDIKLNLESFNIYVIGE